MNSLELKKMVIDSGCKISTSVIGNKGTSGCISEINGARILLIKLSLYYFYIEWSHGGVHFMVNLEPTYIVSENGALKTDKASFSITVGMQDMKMN